MVIGIVGNYGNNNQGDEAILEGILIQLKELHRIERENIIVFSNQPEQTSKKYGVKSAKLYYKRKTAPGTFFKTMYKNRKLIQKLDLLLIGGGGIFMDLYGREAFLFGLYGGLAKLSKTPVVLYGVGAGPILTRTGKIVLRSLAHLSELVTVRDPKSKELLQSIGVKSTIHVIADPAFQLEGSRVVREKQKTVLQFGVTAVPYHHGSYWPNQDMNKYTNFVRGMAANLDQLLSDYPDATINFFATKYPQDIAVSEEICSRMKFKHRCTICKDNLTPDEIVEFASTQDVLIGTRLHSLILGLVTATPIIAVSYHHKVQDFMDMIKCQDYVIPIENIDSNHRFFLDSYTNMINDWEKTTQRFSAISDKMKQKATEGMDLVRRTYYNLAQAKRILVLSNMYPSKHSKTFGIFVKNQVEEIRNQGLTVDVIAIDDPRKGKIHLLMKYGRFFIKNLWNLIIRGRKYDAIHIHYIFPTGLVGLLYKKLLNKRIIVTSHGGDIDQMSRKSGTVKKYTRKILQQADHVITVGETLKQNIVEDFHIDSEKVAVINMGVNRDVFYPQDQEIIRKEYSLSQNNKVILFVGNLIRAKGLDDLVHAFKIVHQQVENASLHLIGEPKDATYFTELQEKVSDNPAIVVHDSLPQHDIAKWMSVADIFVLPSHIEGFGLVALEAMACELPVVGTNVGGLRFLLDNDAGIKAKPHNPTDLAKKLIGLLTDEELRLQVIQNGLKKAEKFDQTKLVEQVVLLYEDEEKGTR